MTREEAKEILKAYRNKLSDSVSNQLDEDIKAFNEAIQALEQTELKSSYNSVKTELNGDAISRQAALDEISRIGLCKSSANEVQAVKECLIATETLPPVTLQPKTGRWIPLEYDGYADGNPVWDKWECSKCGWEHSGDEESLTAFCPNCGQPKIQEVEK